MRCLRGHFEQTLADFEGLCAALRAGDAFANVHTTVFGPGEMRGQIQRRKNDD